MTRWDVDTATDEQMQAESESEDTACLSDLDTLLNSTELYLSLAVKRETFTQPLTRSPTDPCRIKRQKKQRKSQPKDDVYQS